MNYKKKYDPTSQRAKNVSSFLNVFYRISCFDRSVSGGALYISIIVSILISVILTLAILLSKYSQQSVMQLAQNAQLYYNLKSALEIVKSSYFTENTNDIWIKNTTNQDSTKIKKINWGAYLLISVQTKNRHNKFSQTGLYGTFMSSDTGLVVSDLSRPVGMSGNIILRANCFLSKAGTKSMQIKGQGYFGNLQNTRFIKQSEGQIQNINKNYLASLASQQSIDGGQMDSIVDFMPSRFHNSFEKRTVLWKPAKISLNDLHLKDNVKIICENIVIDNSCQFDNVLIVCKKIRFKEGFRGKVHVIASDSIISEKNCIYNYPSSFVLLANTIYTTGLKTIQFNNDNKFSGAVIAIERNENHSPNKKLLIKLDAESEVNGLLYSAGYLHVEGNVNAVAICDKLLHVTPGGVYENQIFTCKIDPKKCAGSLVVPSIFSGEAKLLCCEKLN